MKCIMRRVRNDFIPAYILPLLLTRDLDSVSGIDLRPRGIDKFFPRALNKILIFLTNNHSRLEG